MASHSISNIRNSLCRIQTSTIQINPNSSMIHYHYSFRKHRSTLISLIFRVHRQFSHQVYRIFDLGVTLFNTSHQFAHIDVEKVSHPLLIVRIWTHLKSKFTLQRDDARSESKRPPTGKIRCVTLKLSRDVGFKQKI